MKRLQYTITATLSIIATFASAHAEDLDNPLPPVNPVATMSDDFSHVTLTWEYPGDIGENGGRVDPNKITYYIFDAFGSFYAPALAETKSTSYTFDYSGMSGQDFVAYQLTAGMDEIWYSLPVNSNIVCVGQPHALPFSESFASGKQTFPWCVDPASSPYVSTAIIKDDNKPIGTPDNGYLRLTTKKADQIFSLTSVKIEKTAPQHEMYLGMSMRGQDTEVFVEIARDGGVAVNGSQTPIEPGTDWQPYTLEFDHTDDATYVQIRFTFRFKSSDAWVSVDDISAYEKMPGAVNDISSDADGTITQYYTVGGQLLSGKPTSPGIYICRNNKSTKKIIVK